MGPQRPHFTLLLSGGKASRKGTLDAVDPEIEPFKSALEREGIGAVDLTDVSSADQLQHGTFAENPHVVQIISRWIASERLVENIMSTTVSAAVGNAARLTDPIWQFLTDKAVILGAIAAIIAIAGKFAGGMWRFVAFVAKKRGKGPSTPSAGADGGVAAGCDDITGPVNTNTRDDSKG